ncbi:hypothetical protein AB0P32_16840 [Streptomyces sp. NPDC085995]|uniref:hypothetical protein n=1 Tax=Streptomyces sp. NPDC085995 TaxID=3154861 RepID=UPI00341ACAA5
MHTAPATRTRSPARCFHNKGELLRTAFHHAFGRAYAREPIGDVGGLTALCRLCREIMPLEVRDVRRPRAVVAFSARDVHERIMNRVFRSAVSHCGGTRYGTTPTAMIGLRTRPARKNC